MTLMLNTFKNRWLAPVGSLLIISNISLADPYVLSFDHDPFAEWSIRGSNTLRGDWYGFSGDAAGNPHTFLDEQYYDEFNLNVTRQFSTYDNLSANMFGVLSNSDYRTTFNGLLIERASIKWQKGDVAIPFKLELGDFFGFYSQRSLNTSLKGGQLELQPTLSLWGEQHSFNILAGSRVSDYRDANDFNDSYFVASSWLMNVDKFNFSLNYVGHYDDASAAGNGRNLWQNIFSIASNYRFEFSEQHRLTIDAELSHFFGELAAGNGEKNNRGGLGSYVQLYGVNGPLNYGFRYERYEQNFRPAGGSVGSDQQTIELTSSWQTVDGIIFSGRLQNFTNALQTSNPVDTSVVGVNIAGAIAGRFWPRMSATIDTFMQDTEDRDSTSHTRNYSVNVNLNAPLTDVWSGRMGVLYNLNRDELLDRDTNINHQLNVGAGRAWQLGEVNGSFDIGSNIRYNDSQGHDTIDFSPVTSINGNYREHRLSLSYNALRRDALFDEQQNLITHALSVVYNWTLGPHAFTVDADFGLRDPDNVDDTEHFRAGLSYSFAFDKPKNVNRKTTPTLSAQIPENTAPITTAEFDLTALIPGMAEIKAYQYLEDTGFQGATPFSNGIFFETRYLDNVRQRQRLALVSRHGVINKVALVIDLSRVGDLRNVAQVYDNVRKDLIIKYGQPTLFERGQFSPNIARDLIDSNFIRVAEWQTTSGVLRLGIPRRVDGQVRIEIQHGKSFSAPTELRWSIESFR